MIRVHIEPLVDRAAIIRVGDGFVYGQPYSWVCVARYLTDTAVRIEGALRAPTPSEWRAVAKKLRSDGIREIQFERKRNGKNELHKVK